MCEWTTLFSLLIRIIACSGAIYSGAWVTNFSPETMSDDDEKSLVWLTGYNVFMLLECCIKVIS